MADLQGIIQNKSASCSWTLPLVRFDKKVPFFPKIVLFYGISGKNYSKSALFKDSRCCPKILDYIHSVLGFLPKQKRGLGLDFGAQISTGFHKNVPYLILYQWTKFQCHTFLPSQNIKPNVLLSSYLDS